MNGLYQDTMLARCLAEAKYRIGEEAHRSHQSWVQSPIFVLTALSECLTTVGGYEIAYNEAPEAMKAFMMAILLSSSAMSAILGQVLTPIMKDPYLIWAWAAPTVALACQTVIFFWLYRSMNKPEACDSIVESISATATSRS